MITDEQIERGCRAMCVFEGRPQDATGDYFDSGAPKDQPSWKHYEAGVRVVLEAAQLPSYGLEQAAKIVDEIAAKWTKTAVGFKKSGDIKSAECCLSYKQCLVSASIAIRENCVLSISVGKAVSNNAKAKSWSCSCGYDNVWEISFCTKCGDGREETFNHSASSGNTDPAVVVDLVSREDGQRAAQIAAQDAVAIVEGQRNLWNTLGLSYWPEGVSAANDILYVLRSATNPKGGA